ncbi:EAL domain-containing protein, partial [Enterobacter sp. DRP3]|nr:EAL domain-containing protein [Enterobacter sp. DRP3]
IGLVLMCAFAAPFFMMLGTQQTSTAWWAIVLGLGVVFPILYAPESLLFAHDPVVSTYANRARRSAEISRIRTISEYDFYLEYQPQVSLRDGRCTGCEALLRATGPEGMQQAPLEFLRWLAQADLMREVDLWVAKQAVLQCHAWRKADF